MDWIAYMVALYYQHLCQHYPPALADLMLWAGSNFGIGFVAGGCVL